MPRPLLSAAFLIALPFAASGQQPFREFKGCEAPIRNVVFITADVHYAAAHYYDPALSKFTDFNPFWEFVAAL